MNSRHQKRTNSIWRRRVCLQCKAVVTSLESTDYSSTWRVETTASHIVPFERDELLISIYDACRHRPNATADASALTRTVISLLASGMQPSAGLIKRPTIITTTCDVLKRFDTVAYTHYQAFHHL